MKITFSLSQNVRQMSEIAFVRESNYTHILLLYVLHEVEINIKGTVYFSAAQKHENVAAVHILIALFLIKISFHFLATVKRLKR